VLLPDDYDANKKYRVLYVLPVQPWESVRHGSGLEEILALDVHNRRGVICVFPTFSDWPWYVDHDSDPGIRQISYVARDVVPLVDAHYSTTGLASDRQLLGFSKSGWGAFALLLLHPETFGKAVAWDSPLNWTEPSERAAPIFGSQENFKRYSIVELIRTRGRLLGETPRLFNFGCPGKRGPAHTEIHQLLNELGIPHKHTDGQALKHAWASGWMPEAVEFLLR
jgi:enterochelin esterase-like enzyme